MPGQQATPTQIGLDAIVRTVTGRGQDADGWAKQA